MIDNTLTAVLEKWFGKALTKLPSNLRPIASRYIKDWSSLSASERRMKAGEVDRQRELAFNIRMRKAHSKQDQGTQQDPEFVAAWEEVVNEASSESPGNKDIEEEIGCRRLIREHWPTIKALHGPDADGRQVRRVLKDNIDESEKLPELKTVQNRLIDLRKENLIP
jgi:hypothetical protein